MYIDWGDIKQLSEPLQVLLSAWVGYPALWTLTRKTKKKKESWSNMSVHFSKHKVPTKHILFAKWKVQTSRNKRAHMLFIGSKRPQAHTPTFILFVKLCKKPILHIVFPPVRKLVKTQHWHILDIVLSLLTLYWVLQGGLKLDYKKLLHQR